MQAFPAIHGFIEAVRARLRLVAAGTTGVWAVTALLALGLLVPLVAAAASPAAAGALRAIALLLLVAVVVAAVLFGLLLPRRRTVADADVARWVGARVPPLASDLLSAVELGRPTAAAPFSPDLLGAFVADTANRLVVLRPHALVPSQWLRRGALAAAGAAAVYALALAAAPGALGRGWSRLVAAADDAGRGDGPIEVNEPLVGDLNLTLRFPAYTGRAQVVVPSSTGDILAPRGTEVTIETTPLRPATMAFLVFDGSPGRRVPMVIEGEKLHASFVVDRPASYRFMLSGDGSPLVEMSPRRVDVEEDRAPRVDLFAPADELEVSGRKRVELAWSVDDDYGLAEVTLVWRVPGGGREERKSLPLKPGRAAQGKMMWDLTELSLPPGARVPYHLEARDNNDVTGPGIGTSRTFYLKVHSPRERHGELIERQQALFEAALSLLADRLEAEPTDLVAHREIQRRAQVIVVELAQIVALLGKDELAPKKLAGELDAMRGRLEKLARDELALLEDLDRRAARAADGTPGKPGYNLLAASDARNVAELEKDVLILDDWIARQRIEEMLAIQDEIRARRDKLDTLMKEYARTGSDKLRAEIERELRAIEQLERELMEKRARLPGEVADRFVNLDAMEMDESVNCLDKVRERLEAGDAKGAAAKLEECRQQMERAAAGLEQGLRELRGDRFSEEEKAYGELLDEIADLEQEERAIARETQEIDDRYRERAAEVAKEKGNPAREQAKKTLERLRKQLAKVPREGLTPFSQDEYDAVARRLDDVEKMLDEGDVAEALSMAKQAKEGLGAILGDLDDDMADGEPWSDKTDEALEAAHGAEPLLDQLIDELSNATPSPDEILSKQDRQKLGELRRRQQQLRQRTEKLAQKAQQNAAKLPQEAGKAAEQGLKEAGEKMQGAEKRMSAPDPSGAQKEAEGAADRLAGVRRSVQQSARPTSVGDRGRNPDEDEVRIPGAEEYKAPEEFREEILDAKRKGKPPEDYADQIDQYYREITK